MPPTAIYKNRVPGIAARHPILFTGYASSTRLEQMVTEDASNDRASGDRVFHPIHAPQSTTLRGLLMVKRRQQLLARGQLADGVYPTKLDAARCGAARSMFA